MEKPNLTLLAGGNAINIKPLLIVAVFLLVFAIVLSKYNDMEYALQIRLLRDDLFALQQAMQNSHRQALTGTITLEPAKEPVFKG